MASEKRRPERQIKHLLSEQRLKSLFDQQNRILQQEVEKLDREYQRAAKQWAKKQREFTMNTLSRNERMASLFEETLSVEEEIQLLSNPRTLWSTQERRRQTIANPECVQFPSTIASDLGANRKRSKSLPPMSSSFKSGELLHTNIQSVEPFSRNLTPRRQSLKPLRVSKLPDVPEEENFEA